MISFEKNFLFIHTPKTGGNSTQEVLLAYSDDVKTTKNNNQDGLERFGLRNSIYGTTKHSTLEQYYNVIRPDLFNDLFKFSTLRNPWDRMISLYFSPHRATQTWNRRNFLALLNSTPPLNHYICLRDDNGITGHTDIDFLMRFEYLNEDFKTVCKKIDIPAPSLPKRNASTRQHYTAYYDDELVKLVSCKFAKEIELGDYAFNR